MYSFLRISEASALALHTVGVLTVHPNERTTNAEISEMLQVSEHHLAKVHQRLVRSGILRAIRGPEGGFILARPANEIKLLEIVEAIEGPFAPTQCLLGREKCQSDCCILGKMSNSINDQVRVFLMETTADQLSTMTGAMPATDLK
jgi:Rrf2 family protein